MFSKEIEVFVSTKNVGRSKEDGWQQIRESLERLQIDYLDNCHLHALQNEADVEKRLGPDGTLEVLIEARD